MYPVLDHSHQKRINLVSVQSVTHIHAQVRPLLHLWPGQKNRPETRLSSLAAREIYDRVGQ